MSRIRAKLQHFFDYVWKLSVTNSLWKVQSLRDWPVCGMSFKDKRCSLPLSVSLGSIGMGNWWSKVTASSVDVSGNNSQTLSLNDVQNDRSTEVGVDQRITTTSFDLVSTDLLDIAVSNFLVNRVFSLHSNIPRNRVPLIVLNRRTVPFKRLTSVIVSLSHCRDWCLGIYSYHWERLPESIHTICLFLEQV